MPPLTYSNPADGVRSPCNRILLLWWFVSSQEKEKRHLVLRYLSLARTHHLSTQHAKQSRLTTISLTGSILLSKQQLSQAEVRLNLSQSSGTYSTRIWHKCQRQRSHNWHKCLIMSNDFLTNVPRIYRGHDCYPLVYVSSSPI